MIIIGSSEKENIHCISFAVKIIIHLTLYLLVKLFVLYIEGDGSKNNLPMMDT